jgi:biopolymer transport protein ExbD
MSVASDAEMSSEVDDELLLRRKRREHGDDILGLNLTAMMDMFTIILVYLIKVYASAPENLTLNDDLRPPASTAPGTITPAVRVMIAKSGILVDDRVVMQFNNWQGVGGDAASPYMPLREALEKRVDTIRAIESKGGSPFDGMLMVVADGDTPYDVIGKVLDQAGRSQFTSYRLVVRHK